MKTLILILSLTLVQTPGFATENLSGYEEILRELKLSEKTSLDEMNPLKEDPIRIHGSVGVVAGRVGLSVPAGLSSSQSLQGVEAVMGIDLFSKRWLAEGALRSFEAEPYSSTELSMREFDLRVIHQIPLMKTIEVRWGLGMAARYLNFSETLSNYQLKNEYSTPASILLTGLRFHFNHVIGISADASLRSRLVNDTIDKGSFDTSIRLTGSF